MVFAASVDLESVQHRSGGVPPSVGRVLAAYLGYATSTCCDETSR